jgi:hypothetical protein
MSVISYATNCIGFDKLPKNDSASNKGGVGD